jgi:hypothetical protein
LEIKGLKFFRFSDHPLLLSVSVVAAFLSPRFFPVSITGVIEPRIAHHLYGISGIHDF